MNFKSYKQWAINEYKSKGKEWSFEPDDRNHYVYRITSVKLDKHYYGSRTTRRKPKDDLGIHYFSSSADKQFKQDLNDNPQDYKFKVVRVFDNKLEMLLLESYLHTYFNVSTHLSFFNRQIQTLFGYSTAGMVYIKDKNGDKYLVSKNDPRYLSGELVSANKGLKSLKRRNHLVLKDKEGNTKYAHREFYNEHRDEYKNVIGGFVVFDKETGKYIQIDKEEYDYNIHSHICSGKVNVKFRDSDEGIQIDTEDFNPEIHKFVNEGKTIYIKNGKNLMITSEEAKQIGASHFNKDKITVYDEKLGRNTSVTREEFNSGEFKSPNKGKIHCLNIISHISEFIKTEDMKHHHLATSLLKRLKFYKKDNIFYKRKEIYLSKIKEYTEVSLEEYILNYSYSVNQEN